MTRAREDGLALVVVENFALLFKVSTNEDGRENEMQSPRDVWSLAGQSPVDEAQTRMPDGVKNRFQGNEICTS